MSARWSSAALANKPANAQKPPQERRTPPATPKEPTQASEGRTACEITFNSVVPGNNGPNGLLRMGWRKRQRLAADYEWVVAAARLRPMVGPVRLELVRYSIGPAMDYDNLVSTGKATTDALVRCGILPNDNPTIIAERSYTQERAAGKGYQRTVIRLIPL